jgi:hypothetical protein
VRLVIRREVPHEPFPPGRSEKPSWHNAPEARGLNAAWKGTLVTHRNVIAVVLIGLIVAGTAYWTARHWDTYAGILAGLWPLLVGLLVALASLLEVAWWLRFDAWYYRFGPKTSCEQWQTCGTGDQIRAAIRPALDAEGWIGQESSVGFFIRRASFWRYGSRVSLRLEDTAQGTAVRYEVRPLLTAPLWLVAVAALFLSRFNVFFFNSAVAWIATPCFCVLLIWAVAYYPWLAPREAQRMARVRHIRAVLATYRLGVCEECGYDLTGNVSGRCPECGELVEGKTG